MFFLVINCNGVVKIQFLHYSVIPAQAGMTKQGVLYETINCSEVIILIFYNPIFFFLFFPEELF